VVLWAERDFVPRTHHLAVNHPHAILACKNRTVDVRQLEAGIKFARQQNSMEALIVLAFCMTGLSMPLRTYLPVFVKDIFHRGPETYGNSLRLWDSVRFAAR